jgi:uncharacterized phage infection (PIP) family protein YhgE
VDKSEQILELITEMNKGIKEDFKGIRSDMQKGFTGVYSTMQEELSNVYSDVKDVRTELKSDIKKVKMTLENDTNKNINLLVEGQQNLNAKIDEVLKFESEKELLTIRIEILENELNRLKARLDEIA